MRLKVVDWLLTFLPSKRAHPNLYDQLVTSPETRFQSIALFLTCLKQTVEENNWAHFVDAKCRARLIVDAGDDNRQLTADEEHCNTEEDVAEYEKEEFMEGLRLIVWDIAVGALALSVKFHRDNLPPLLPIYADEFIDIAPHDVEYQTFEECQRDILRSVSYMFGVTPQPLMDNLWLALPELQTVLDYDGPSGSEDFSKASGLLFRSARAEADIAKRWNCVRRRAWELLIRTCREADVLRFDTAILTAATLLQALVDVCAMQEELIDGRWNVLDLGRAGIAKAPTETRWVRRARRRVLRDDIEDKICEALGVEEERLVECKRWLAETKLA